MKKGIGRNCWGHGGPTIRQKLCRRTSGRLSMKICTAEPRPADCGELGLGSPNLYRRSETEGDTPVNLREIVQVAPGAPCWRGGEPSWLVECCWPPDACCIQWENVGVLSHEHLHAAVFFNQFVEPKAPSWCHSGRGGSYWCLIWSRFLDHIEGTNPLRNSPQKKIYWFIVDSTLASFEPRCDQVPRMIYIHPDIWYVHVSWNHCSGVKRNDLSEVQCGRSSWEERSKMIQVCYICSLPCWQSSQNNNF